MSPQLVAEPFVAFHLTMSNSPSRSRGAFSAPGVSHRCFAHPNRRVGGAPRNVRVRAKHPWGVSCASETRVNALMTRYARRLRGALRPMTQQYTRRNNVTISMPGGGSVPIVSQTEIEPMKTALSLMLPLITTALDQGRCPCRSRRGRAARARTAIPWAPTAHRRWVLRTPSRNRATALARGDGLRLAPIACEMDARGSSLTASLRFLRRGSIAVPRGSPPRRLRRPIGRRAGGRVVARAARARLPR